MHNNNDIIISKGFMSHGDDRFRFPGSRDFMLDPPVCIATMCICNSGGYCFAPSRVEIGEDGRCRNFKKKIVKLKNPNIQGL